MRTRRSARPSPVRASWWCDAAATSTRLAPRVHTPAALSTRATSTTTGRHSGMARTVPLFYLEDGERVVLVASKRGMSTNPDWYLNIQANPRVTVDLEGDAQAMLARTATPEEKAGYWPRLVEMFKL